MEKGGILKKRMREKFIFKLSVSSTVANPSIKVEPVTRPETFRATFALPNALVKARIHLKKTCYTFLLHNLYRPKA